MRYSYDMIDLIAALIGSLVVGGLLGLVPLRPGQKKGWPGTWRLFCLSGRRPYLGVDPSSTAMCAVHGIDFCDQAQNDGCALWPVSGADALSRPCGTVLPAAGPSGRRAASRRAGAGAACIGKNALGGTGAEINQTKGNGPRPFPFV